MVRVADVTQLAPPADGKPQFLTFSVPVLKVRDFPGPLWDLMDSFSFWSAIVKQWITAPAGFRTDGNSIPPIALSLVGYVADEPGYLHDLMYTTQMFSRITCDKILREMVLVRGYKEAIAQEFYFAVRLGGGSHWRLPNVPQSDRVAALLHI